MSAQTANTSSGVLGVGSTLVSGLQSRKDAEAQQEAQAINNREIDKTAYANYSDLSRAEVSVQEQSNLSSLEQQKVYFRARGKVLSSLGAAGTAGGSVDSILNDLNRTKGQNLSTITKNRRTQLDEIALQAEQIRQGAKASKSNRVFNKPSGLQIGLQVGAAIADTAAKAAIAGG